VPLKSKIKLGKFFMSKKDVSLSLQIIWVISNWSEKSNILQFLLYYYLRFKIKFSMVSLSNSITLSIEDNKNWKFCELIAF
jgi:hypothetical protein